MKLLLVTTLLLSAFALNAHAEEQMMHHHQHGIENVNTGENAQKFTEIKADILKKIDERKACVSAAMNLEDLKKCHQHGMREKPEKEPM